MDRKSDELILQGLRQGDCKAFDELYMRYAPRVEAFACCMLKSRSEAEDLAHDIFLKIWENRRSIGHIRSLGNYLFRMTKNASALLPAISCRTTSLRKSPPRIC